MEQKTGATVYSSLLLGVLVVLSLVVLIFLSTITREVSSWITWCYNIKHLHSLPSPPSEHWIWGHATVVSNSVKISTLTLLLARRALVFAMSE